MKIILEFESWEEHNAYIDAEYSKRAEGSEEVLSVGEAALKHARIPDYTRRRMFSDYEIGFVKDYYQKKKITWIAKALRRKPAAVYMLLNRLYREGLPRKQNRHGKVLES